MGARYARLATPAVSRATAGSRGGAPDPGLQSGQSLPEIPINRSLIALLAFVVPTAAFAAPPADHPTPQDAGKILGVQAAQAPGEAPPYKGTVVETIDANAYTYILLKDGNTQR